MQFNKNAVGEENAGKEFVWLKGMMWEKPIYRSPDSSEAEMGEGSQDRLVESTGWDLRLCMFVCMVCVVCAPGL